ncbi:hypothetical protein [Hymenobacter sp. BT730]|uniref:hypothetical protein n=1 Tax=Hymenobacter sp. BT730 TaxID=3063332 RepID=UPI0026E0C28C|nr:hypothetical protein [Hymenobacter sp. BT730]
MNLSTRFSTILVTAFCCGVLLGTSAEASAKPTGHSLRKQEPEINKHRDTTGEYLEIKSLTINGKQPFLGKTAALFKVLGLMNRLVEPDKNDVCNSYYDKPFRYAYFNNSLVEVYRDTAAIRSLDLRQYPKLELRTATFRLSHKTTLADLAMVFPESVKAQSTTNMAGMGNITTVSIATKAQATEDAWLLFFENGRLIRIDYWMPC